jgi:hypothetical protein
MSDDNGMMTADDQLSLATVKYNEGKRNSVVSLMTEMKQVKAVKPRLTRTQSFVSKLNDLFTIFTPANNNVKRVPPMIKTTESSELILNKESTNTDSINSDVAPSSTQYEPNTSGVAERALLRTPPPKAFLKSKSIRFVNENPPPSRTISYLKSTSILNNRSEIYYSETDDDSRSTRPLKTRCKCAVEKCDTFAYTPQNTKLKEINENNALIRPVGFLYNLKVQWWTFDVF